MIVFSVIGLLNVFLVSGGRAGRPRRWSRPARNRARRAADPFVAAAVVALVWVVRVGDLGARAVWNPTAPSMIPF